MPPSVACADVLTSTGNHRPCGSHHALSASRTMPGSTVTVRASRSNDDDTVEMLAVIDDQRRANRLPALRAAGAARQQRHAKLAADIERRPHVGVVPRNEHADRFHLVDRRVGRVAAARRTVEQDVALRRRRAGAARGRRRRLGAGTRGAWLRALSRTQAASRTGDTTGGYDTFRIAEFAGFVRRLISEVPCSSSTRTRPGAISCRFPARPTCRTGCCARSTGRPSIIAGPSSRASTQEILDGLKDVFQTTGPDRHLRRVRHRRVGSGARQYAVARRSRADVRDRPLRDAMASDGRDARPRRRLRPRRLAQRHRSRAQVEAKLAEDRAHTIKAVLAVHNETSTGVTSRIPEIRHAIDRAGHPALFMVDTISLARVDRLSP